MQAIIVRDYFIDSSSGEYVCEDRKEEMNILLRECVQDEEQYWIDRSNLQWQ